ncbi:hypothetical protein KFK09_012652 [Dendrobium nobile]|uniref:RING-type E3 ubiquitin transferase n=1 Tax=Dendrobium nobile TaxID=94219 RepID=A0A8T3BLF0_DENNO|nr:hypothetical protein KFK09_012652 [Dendrobium nobile]
MLALDLSTLLNILPLSDLRLSDDVRDLVDLLHSQCCRARSTVDPDVSNLRREILSIIHEIECEIVPERSRLAAILHNLGLDDTQSCRREVECLEREIGERVSEKWTAAMISLVGVVQYAKCVLYGASTPRSDSSAGKLFFASYDSAGGSQNGGTPPDFRCPISLDLMRDPVVVASGQTFDRESITHWIRSGHATCPSTGQALRHTNLIPNRALKNLISRWCREQNVPFALSAAGEPAVSGGIENKAALEAARMTAAFLVQKLSTSPSTEAANRIVHELRQLAKTQSENRAFIAEAGAVPLLLPFLCSNDSTLQLNAVTTLLNLSIFEPNKRRIMRADGSIDAVIHVMSNGEAWQAKENAATLLLSLSSMHSYRRRIGENHSAVAELVKLVRNGPASTKNDAMAAILSLAGDRKIVPLLVEKGVLEAALDMFAIEEAAETAAAVIAGMAKRGGTVVVEKLEREGAVSKLVGVLRRGTDSARDNAAAALVVLCRQSGGGVVAEVASMPGIEKVIRELMGFGTGGGAERQLRWGGFVGDGLQGEVERISTAIMAMGSGLVAVMACRTSTDFGFGIPAGGFFGKPVIAIDTVEVLPAAGVLNEGLDISSVPENVANVLVNPEMAGVALLTVEPEGFSPADGVVSGNLGISVVVSNCKLLASDGGILIADAGDCVLSHTATPFFPSNNGLLNVSELAACNLEPLAVSVPPAGSEISPVMGVVVENGGMQVSKNLECGTDGGIPVVSVGLVDESTHMVSVERFSSTKNLVVVPVNEVDVNEMATCMGNSSGLTIRK